MTLPNIEQRWFSPWSLAVGVGAWMVAAMCSCQSSPCPPFQGEWETEEGHRWSFQSNGQLLWIVRFGSTMDTMRLTYRYDCSHSPAVLDLTGFDGGPWQSKTLYGIVEWSGDSVFRFCAAAGTESSVRPEHFDQTETVRFFRAK